LLADGLCRLIQTGASRSSSVQRTRADSIKEGRNYIDEVPYRRSRAKGETFHWRIFSIDVSWGGNGRVIVVKDGTSITTTMTRGLSEALKEAGYTPVSPDPSSAPSDNTTIGAAVLEGEIREFWLRPWWTTQHVVRIDLRLMDSRSGHLLWEKEMQGEHSKFIGVWNVGEFEEVIQKALDKLLRQAGKEFASEQFYLKVKDGN
jgi:hypothetical protein